ncbi:MAG: hypothetical protein R3Y13_00485 [bacterium]
MVEVYDDFVKKLYAFSNIDISGISYHAFVGIVVLGFIIAAYIMAK